MGRNSVPPTWPYGGGHELDCHPGIFPMPGSTSVFAGHVYPFTPASAGEAHPSLSSTFSTPDRVGNGVSLLPIGRGTCGRVLGRVRLSIDGTGFASRISRFRNFSTARREFGDQTGGDGREPLHSVSAFHGLKHGASDEREAVKVSPE